MAMYNANNQLNNIQLIFNFQSSIFNIKAPNLDDQYH
jgi:hypothetical protein